MYFIERRLIHIKNDKIVVIQTYDKIADNIVINLIRIIETKTYSNLLFDKLHPRTVRINNTDYSYTQVFEQLDFVISV